VGKNQQHLDRIPNLMAADIFFNKKYGVRAINRLEKERFTLQPVKARKKLYKPSYKPNQKVEHFEQWQLDLAVKVLKGNTDG
jgi:hypothetical protein